MTALGVLLAAVAVVSFLAGRLTAGPPRVPAQPPKADVDDEVRDHLEEPPPGHGVIKVPSVHRDARGAIHNFDVDGVRVNVLVSRAGSERSGDVHRFRQMDAVIKGRVTVVTREGGRDVERTYTTGDSISVPPHVPHLFRFHNDTWMMEWWAGPFEARYYRPYRTSVERAAARLGAAQAQAHSPKHRALRQKN